MKRYAVLAALLFSATTATARPLLDVSVTDLDANQLLTTYPGSGRTYVVGAPGHRYSLTLRNNSSQRVLAVVSVDGVNAVTGETASAKQSGYVLGPWETAEVRGWRKNLSDVAEFYFTELPDSYAARTGRPDNVGVIGVAVYREKQQPIAQQPSVYDDRKARAYGESGGAYGAAARAREPAAADGPSSGNARAERESARAPAEVAGAPPAPAASMPRTPDVAKAAPRQMLGTGHGERRYDPVGTTAFERASSHPEQVVSIFYDSYAVLVDRGIIPQPYRPSREPDPFPIGFVPDPR